MIRNVVVGRLRDAPDPDQAVLDRDRLDAALAGIEALGCPGRVGSRVGRDAGLRDGGWDFAITNDWVDAAAYRVYDADAEHNRLRREEFAPVCAEIVRVQLELPDGP